MTKIVAEPLGLFIVGGVVKSQLDEGSRQVVGPRAMIRTCGWLSAG